MYNIAVWPKCSCTIVLLHYTLHMESSNTILLVQFKVQPYVVNLKMYIYSGKMMA